MQTSYRKKLHYYKAFKRLFNTKKKENYYKSEDKFREAFSAAALSSTNVAPSSSANVPYTAIDVRLLNLKKNIESCSDTNCLLRLMTN